MRHLVTLFAVFSTGAVSALASVDSGLLALVPSNAKIISSIDVTSTRNSPFGQQLLSKMGSGDSHFEDMIVNMGFDPRRDLQSVLFATNGLGDAEQPESFAVLARGNFDQNKIKTFAVTKGKATIQKYGGLELIMETDGSGKKTAIAFLDTGVAALADVSTLKQIIDGRLAPQSLSPDLKSKIASIGAANDAWFVSTVGGLVLGNHMGTQGNQQARALQGVVQASGGMKFGANVETTVDAVTRSPKDAASLADVIRFFASMVQMQRQNDPNAEIVAKAFDGMKLENSGTAVHFAISMPEKSLEQILDSATHAH